MRFLQSKRWRRFCYAMLFVAILAGGLFIYPGATASSVRRVNFGKLQPGMTRISVEAILGPATAMKPIDELATRGPKGFTALDQSDGFHPIPGIMDYSQPVTWWGSGNLGNLGDTATEIRRSNDDQDKIASAGIWDGPEARIIVSFDADNQVIGARIIERVTWRFKLRRWLPWLP